MATIKDLEQRIKGMSQKDALGEIARAMQARGADQGALDKLLDRVLKMENIEEDRELVGEWERTNRGE